MLTKDTVKAYLRIAGNDDNDYIDSMLASGKVYLANAVDDFDTKYQTSEAFETLADNWLLTQWCPVMYDQREGMTQGNNNINFVARALLTQLQLMTLDEEVEE